MSPEKSFEIKVKKYLQSFGKQIWHFKVWGGGYQRSGIPDLIACVNGIFVAIELKSDSGKASELQKYNIKLINKSNGLGIILYPTGFESFKKIIEEVVNCNAHTPVLNALKSAPTNTSCYILND